MRVKISGTGMCVPDQVVTNHDLEKMMDTTDEWIQQRSGIVERRWVGPDQKPADLAEAAARQALQRADLDVGDVDCILVATLSAQAEFPGTSFFLHAQLEAGDIPCVDVRAQCSGFLYALSMARAYILAGVYRRVLVVGAEVHSTGLDKTTRGRNVSVLFGDGAGAVVLERNDDENDPASVLEVRLHAQGEFAKKLWVEIPGSATYPERINEQLLAEARQYPVMEGRFVFKHAVTRMPEVLRETLDAASVKLEDVDLFLFHQANLRINEYVADHLGIPAEKTLNNIQRYGNCSAASIPILMHEAEEAGLLSPGKQVCMTGFGSGFTWASAVVRW